ncbi:MAG: STAS domain-containing protein [Rhodococcus sp. (in: high G+C Gram-positive bacteria)]|jgi:anti-anti-sigma factor|uniref:STAS domain-containing protein n=1 Tax=Rhodococcus sp. EPR-157 TaxID=1813677 RepID=UPI0007BC6A68|nr:STAS domain-containing protein [Rhodococcus sp. EPR-157]KZF08913.1 sulfate transporter [Rhodococcus sp. EPR-157]
MITAANSLSVDAAAQSVGEAPRYSVEVESYSTSYSVLRVSGDLDMTARPELTGKLEDLLSSGADVLVDLSAVSFIYSGAANAVIDAASATDSRVRIFAPTRPVRMILDVLGAGVLIVDSRSREWTS